MRLRLAGVSGSLRWAWLPALLLIAGMASVQAQSSGPTIPALQTVTDALPDATIVDRSSADFATYPLIVARIDQRGGIKGNIASTRTVEGDLGSIVYKLNGAQPDNVITAIKQRLLDNGFKTLYTCSGDACGPTFTRTAPGFRQHQDKFNVAVSAQHYAALQKSRQGGDMYVSVQVVRGSAANAPVYVQLDVVQVEPRVVGAITVNAAEMARKLQTKGRVALYGLFFATDSAKIKQASRGTLGEIAKLLANKPDMKLLVVGHTDNRGNFEYNLKLSQRRAHAVVDALVQDYGIDPNRLKPWGVSFAAPTASNINQFGRSRNRRVELVVW